MPPKVNYNYNVREENCIAGREPRLFSTMYFKFLASPGTRSVHVYFTIQKASSWCLQNFIAYAVDSELSFEQAIIVFRESLDQLNQLTSTPNPINSFCHNYLEWKVGSIFGTFDLIIKLTINAVSCRHYDYRRMPKVFRCYQISKTISRSQRHSWGWFELQLRARVEWDVYVLLSPFRIHYFLTRKQMSFKHIYNPRVLFNLQLQLLYNHQMLQILYRLKPTTNSSRINTFIKYTK